MATINIAALTEALRILESRKLERDHLAEGLCCMRHHNTIGTPVCSECLVDATQIFLDAKIIRDRAYGPE